MSDRPDPLSAAREYLSRGWAPVPLPHRCKRPVLPAWQTLRLTEADLPAHEWGGVGLILGEPSGGLTDIDLDAPEAVALADAFLPATGLVSGRAGKPRSHRWYISTPIPETCQYRAPDGTMLVELRSTGGQTVVPPSLHPSGESYVWHEYGAPSPIAAEDLGRAVARLASAALIARHWPAKGSRNEAALALAGLLLRAGWEEEETVRLVCSVSAYAGDPHTVEVWATVRRLAAGGRATGGPKLAALIGEEVVARVREWLGLRSAAEPVAWEAPVPLCAHPDLPEFPAAALPEWGSEFVSRLAESTETPSGLAGALAIGVLAGSVAGKFQVEVKPGWWEPSIGLYLMCALRSGERKSAVFGETTRPLWEYERERALALAPDIEQATQARDLLSERAKVLRGVAARAKSEARKAAEEALSEASRELAAVEVPKAPRLIADDVTPEALVALLADNGGRLVVASSAGGLFETLAGRYSDGVANLDAVLKAHAGDSIRVDRMGRPPLYIPRPALSLVLAVQPDVVRGLAGKPGFRGRGLIARILYCVPDSRVGSRLIDVPGMRSDIIAGWGAGVRSLLALPAPAPAERPPVLKFADGALRLLLDFMRELEPRLGERGDLYPLADWASKLAGAVARIAVVLALADAHGTVPPEVTEDAVRRALDLGRYFLAHASAAFATMGADPATEHARHVLDWLKRERRSPLTRRDILRGVRGTVHRVADLTPALALLVDHGYMRELDAGERHRPGRPPQRYGVHPSIVGGEVENADEDEPLPVATESCPVPSGQNGQNGQNAEEGDGAKAADGNPVHSVHIVQASTPTNGDPDYPTGWTIGDAEACAGCGLDATSRDPRA